jgi:hypothetical protein
MQRLRWRRSSGMLALRTLCSCCKQAIIMLRALARRSVGGLRGVWY